MLWMWFDFGQTSQRCLKSLTILFYSVLHLPDLGPRKEILQEYFDISTLLHHEVVRIHREMSSALTAIDPHREYESFIHQNR